MSSKIFIQFLHNYCFGPIKQHQTNTCNNKYRTSLLFFGALVSAAHVHNAKNFAQHSAYIWSGKGTSSVDVELKLRNLFRRRIKKNE